MDKFVDFVTELGYKRLLIGAALITVLAVGATVFWNS